MKRGRKPDYRIMAAYNSDGRKPYFSEIGAGWINKNKRIILDLREIPRERNNIDVVIYLNPVTDDNKSSEDANYENYPFDEKRLEESDLI